MVRCFTTNAATLLAALIAIAGCIPQPAKTSKPLQATQALVSTQSGTNGCAPRSSAPWKTGGETFTIEAFTDGPDCLKAVAVLVIRNAKSEILWIDTFQVSQNLALSDAKSEPDMQRALSDWITETDNDGKPILATTADLPAWSSTETQPIRGEFPFYPEEGVTREDYTKLRDQKLPMYCYVQGLESESCLALHDGAFEKIGAQSFPG